MENILNYGPKKIVIREAVGDTVVDKERYMVPLNETSLNSIMKHGEDGMIIISSQKSQIDDSNPGNSLRDEFEQDMEQYGGLTMIDSDALYDEMKTWLKKRNALSDRELKQDIKQAGYSYTPVFGGYHGKNSLVDEYEPSYIVYNRKTDGTVGDFQELEQFACDMCGKYKQESVYVQRPGESPVYLDKDGNQVNSSSSDSFKFNRDDEEYYTTTSRDKKQPHRFTADIQFESIYVPIRPASYNEKMRRSKQGEIVL